MHDQCKDIGCQCACGCNVGLPMSNTRNARRSNSCVNGNHLTCDKQSGALCPCNCHIKNFATNRNTFVKDISWFCYTGEHANCKIRFGTCGCTNDKCAHYVAPQTVVTSQSSVPQFLSLPELENKYNKKFGAWSSICIKLSYPEYDINLSPGNDVHSACIHAPNCGCDCHITMLVSNTGKANYKDAVMRLAPIAEEVKRQLMLNRSELTFSFVGETVRDALYRGLVDSYKIEFHYGIGEPAATFVTEHFKKFLQPDGSYKLATKYGDVRIELGTEDDISPWNCDWYSYNLTQGIVKKSSKVGLLESNNALSLVDNGSSIIPSAKEVLEQGAQLALKYGWNIETESINRLTKSIEADKPLENTHELVIGFRSYQLAQQYMSGGYNYHLRGAHGAIWQTKELSVDCPDFKEHVRSVGEDWRGRGTGNANTNGNHDCGIYVYKDPSECLFHYGLDAKVDSKNSAMAIVYCWGVIGEFEHGYRVEHCEIQRLWIWDSEKKLAKNYGIDEVYSGLPFSHFLYDAEVKQVADMNQLKKDN